MKAKNLAVNGAVTVLSLVLGIVLCEAGARLILNPADYLSVTVLSDPVLGMRIAPDSPGFDAWGFRNPAVPPSVDVVTVGDSHTFGNTAKMADAWPSVLGRETGLSVYNLGVGGYGPNQYYQLMLTRGLSLHPKYVLCGLYMGDDFENAYSTTYGLEYWTPLRTGHFQTANADIWGDEEPPGPFKPLRNWLSRNSIVYRLVVHGPVLGALKKALQMKRATANTDPYVTTLNVPDENISEAFRPIRVAAGLDQSRPEVREGMRITFHLLEQMNQACRANGCTFAVVIIPSKETVFADYLERDPQLHLKQLVHSLIANERVARAEVGKFLEKAGIPYVDSLQALRRAATEQELYYRGPADMHPNANGYRVIGEVAAGLVRNSQLNSGRP